MGLPFFDYTERIIHMDPNAEDGSQNAIVIDNDGDYIIRDRESYTTEAYIRMAKSKIGSILLWPGSNKNDLLRIARHRIGNQYAEGTDELQSVLIYINRAIRVIEKFQKECKEHYGSRP